jgi:actin-related protein
MIKINQPHSTAKELLNEYGLNAIRKSPLLSLSNLIEGGYIQDWDMLTEFIQYSLDEICLD